jgi:RimJ/RimL family protein N-acetyltransferase
MPEVSAFTASIFNGELLRLAAPLPEDAAQFARWSQDDAYMRLLDDDPVRPQAPANFAHFGQASAPGHAPDDYYFHLRTLEEDTLIGFVALFSFRHASQTAEMAIGIGDPAYRGKGYGRDALQLILRYAFSELHLYRVSLTVMAYNTAAIRAYERAGFVREGVQRRAVWREGQRHDLVCFGILRDEWLVMQGR